MWFDDQTGQGLIRRDGRVGSEAPVDAVGRVRKEDGWSSRQFNKQSITGDNRGIDVQRRPLIVMRAPG